MISSMARPMAAAPLGQRVSTPEIPGIIPGARTSGGLSLESIYRTSLLTLIPENSELGEFAAVEVLPNLGTADDPTQTTEANRPTYIPGGGLYLPGVIDNYAYVPADDATDMLGDFRADIECSVRLGSERCFFNKKHTNNYYLRVTSDGRLRFYRANSFALSTDSITEDNRWVSVRHRISDGRVQFFTSENGEDWEQLGGDLTIAVTPIAANEPLMIGQYSGQYFKGIIRRLLIFASIDGTDKRLDIDFTKVPHGQTYFRCDAGQPVIINQSGNNPTRIVQHGHLMFDGSQYLAGNLESAIQGHALALPGVSGNYAYADGSGVLTGTNKLDIRVGFVGPIGGTPARSLVSQWTNSYVFRLNDDGFLQVIFFDSSANIYVNAASSIIPPERSVGFRITIEEGGGQSDTEVTFYYTVDGARWVILGEQVAMGPGVVLKESQAAVRIGEAGSDISSGLFTSVQIFASLDGSDKRLDIDFTSQTEGVSSFVCATGQTVTLAQSGDDAAAIANYSYVYPVEGGILLAVFDILGNGGGALRRLVSVAPLDGDEGDADGAILAGNYMDTSNLRAVLGSKALLLPVNEDNTPHTVETDALSGELSLTLDGSTATATDEKDFEFQRYAIGAGVQGDSGMAMALYRLFFLPPGTTDLRLAKVTQYLADAYPLSENLQEMVMTIRTTAADEVFTLPLVDGYGYNFIVNYGDGDGWVHVNAYDDANASHTYASPGDYEVRIVGTCEYIRFYLSSAGGQLVSFDSGGQTGLVTANGMFRGVDTLDAMPGGSWLSQVTDFQLAWNDSAVEVFPVLDVSSGVDFGNAWRNCSITELPLLDLSNGINFYAAWMDTPIGSFPLVDVSRGVFFVSAWQNCVNLTTFPLLDVSSGESFNSSWRGCISLESFPLLDLGSATNLSFAWYGCSSLTAFPLIDVSTTSNFREAWRGCASLLAFPALDLGSGTNFYAAWHSCSGLTAFPWVDFSSGENFNYAWFGCYDLSDFPSGVFDSCASTEFASAFNSTALNQQSVDNILISIDTAGQSNGTLGMNGANISEPSEEGLAAYHRLLAKGWVISTYTAWDAEADSFISSVENADGEELEDEVKNAIRSFISGCKVDLSPIEGVSNWEAIKACCLMAGPRTLAGALTPLTGPAPTNYNFVEADYDRVNGLLGDGSGRYLDSGRDNDDDPQDDQHMSVWVTSRGAVSRYWIGSGEATTGAAHMGTGSLNTLCAGRNRSSSATNPMGSCLSGFAGMSRSASDGFDFRGNGETSYHVQSSQLPYDGDVLVFGRGTGGSPSLLSDAQLRYYSIGEAVSLDLLDARLSTYMAAIESALS